LTCINVFDWLERYIGLMLVEIQMLKALLIAVMLSPAAAWAQDFNKGSDAYQAEDYPTAFMQWKPLAEAGNAEAQASLGLLYRDGKGVLQDYIQALNWFRKAAGKSHASGQTNLGGMYANGWGVVQDFEKAVNWYRKASQQGDAMAQARLAIMYRDGRGVDRNFVTAHMWFNIAGANGDQISREHRDNVAKPMTTAQLAEAHRRAKRCMNSSYQDCD
jgi:hypothetical protein